MRNALTSVDYSTVLLNMDEIRSLVNQKLNIESKKALGQFFTSSNIANFMAQLFSDKINQKTKLLDCGAGIGSLTIPAIHKLQNPSLVEAWEIDSFLINSLESNLANFTVNYQIHNSDFIEDSVANLLEGHGSKYSHAILNPPYKKINSNSAHRKLLRQVGIETVNLYTAFLALTILLMEDKGEIVAIIPRSFCNGLYYKPFRKLLLDNCSIEHIHIFESRTSQFKDDDVLQENIILKLSKNTAQSQVTISQSSNDSFADYRENSFNFNDIVKTSDKELYFHIPTEDNKTVSYEKKFNYSINDLGLNVSTGAVVDFRMKEFLLQNPTEDSIPLLYPHHFKSKKLEYPKTHKKPNALRYTLDLPSLLSSISFSRCFFASL